MQVIIDTEKPITSSDRLVLEALLSGWGQMAKGFPTQAERHAASHTTSPEGEAGIKRDTEAKPAKKAAAKKAAPAAPKKAAEPKPQPAPENSSGAGSDDLRVQAKAAAKAAMDGGNRDAVVAALSSVGEKRVTTMADENLQAFMDALQVELDLV